MSSVKTRTSATGARFALREATAEAHARLDGIMSAFDLADPAGYRSFLMAQAPAFLATEQALEAAGAGGVLPDWPERRRGPDLRRDLADLGLQPPAPAPAPAIDGDAALLGGLYVLEGSRLGGAVLIRSVPAGLPQSFLSPGNPKAWRAFVELLDRRLTSTSDLETATASALAVFALFERAALAVSGASRP